MRRINVLQELKVQLEEEVGATEEELSTLKNQDITIRGLEDRLLSMESELQSQVQEAVAEKEVVIKAAFDKELASMKDLEKAFAARVQRAEEELLQAQAQTDESQGQIFELRTRYEELQAAHQCEVDVLAGQVDRAQAALLSTQKQLERVQESAASRRAADATGGADARTESAIDEQSTAAALDQANTRAVEAEMECARQTVTITSLTQEVQAWKDAVEQHKASHGEAMERMQAQLRHVQADTKAKAAALEEARLELLQRPTTEQMAMLNQRLTSLAGTEEQLQDVKRQLVAAEEALGDSQKLVQRLEREVEDASSTSPVRRAFARRSRGEGALGSESARPGAAGRAGATAGVGASAAAGVGVGAGVGAGAASHNEQLLAVLGDMGGAAEEQPLGGPLLSTPSRRSSGGGGGGGDGDGDGDSTAPMLNILKGQRDRLRVRLQELEAQSGKQAAELAQAHAKVERLMEDNVQLYERIKFVESYTHKQAPPTGTSTSEETRLDVHGSTTKRYQKVYESRMNPFTAFSRQERHKRYTNLSAAEKLTFTTTRLFVSSAMARRFVMFYFFCLHMLVFATLYHFVHAHH